MLKTHGFPVDFPLNQSNEIGDIQYQWGNSLSLSLSNFAVW